MTKSQNRNMRNKRWQKQKGECYVLMYASGKMIPVEAIL
jgi:hypothetical protein